MSYLLLPRLRAFLALCLLSGYVAASAEAVVGFVRDGDVHHESTLAAAVHNEVAHGEHGHEDPAVDEDHGSNHQHGGAGDCCTHAHGVSLPTTFVFEVVKSTAAVVRPATFRSRSDDVPAPPFHPPRA